MLLDFNIPGGVTIIHACCGILEIVVLKKLPKLWQDIRETLLFK